MVSNPFESTETNDILFVCVVDDLEDREPLVEAVDFAPPIAEYQQVARMARQQPDFISDGFNYTPCFRIYETNIQYIAVFTNRVLSVWTEIETDDFYTHVYFKWSWVQLRKA